MNLFERQHYREIFQVDNNKDTQNYQTVWTMESIIESIYHFQNKLLHSERCLKIFLDMLNKKIIDNNNEFLNAKKPSF